MDDSGGDEMYHNTKRKLDKEDAEEEGVVKRPKGVEGLPGAPQVPESLEALQETPQPSPEEEVSALNLLHLSDDVLLCILRHCAPHHLRALSFCCHRLAWLCQERALWRRVDLRPRRLGARALAAYMRAMPPRTTLQLCVRGLVGRPRKLQADASPEDPLRSNSSYVVTSDGSTFCDITVNHRIVLRSPPAAAPVPATPPNPPPRPRRSHSDSNLSGGRFGNYQPPSKDAKNCVNESIKRRLMTQSLDAAGINEGAGCSGANNANDELPNASTDKNDVKPVVVGIDASAGCSGAFNAQNVMRSPPTAIDNLGANDAKRFEDHVKGVQKEIPVPVNVNNDAAVVNDALVDHDIGKIVQNALRNSALPIDMNSIDVNATPQADCSRAGPSQAVPEVPKPNNEFAAEFEGPDEEVQGKEGGGNSSPKPFNGGAAPTDKAAKDAANSQELDGDLTVTKEMMLTIRKKCPNLKELRLEYCYIDCSIIQPSVFPPTLETLSLRGCVCRNVPFSRSYLFRIQDYCPLLQELDLSRCGWLASHSLLVLSKMPRLRRLSLRSCWGLGECVAYASLSARYGFKSLEVLDISGTPMGDSEVSAFSLIGSLRELYLQAVGAGPAPPPDGEPQLEDPADLGLPHAWESEEPMAEMEEELEEEEEVLPEPELPPRPPPRPPPGFPPLENPNPEELDPFGLPNRVHVIYVDVRRARNNAMRVVYEPGAPQHGVLHPPRPGDPNAEPNADPEQPDLPPDIQIRMRNQPNELADGNNEQMAFPQVEIHHELNHDLPYGLNEADPYPEVEIRRDEADRPLNVRVRFGGPRQAIEIPFPQDPFPQGDENEENPPNPGEFFRRGPGFLMLPHLVGREEVVFAEHENNQAARDEVLIEERLNVNNRENAEDPNLHNPGEFLRRGPDFVMLPDFEHIPVDEQANGANIVMHVRRHHGDLPPGQDINIEVQIGNGNQAPAGEAPAGPEQRAGPRPVLLRRGRLNVQVHEEPNNVQLMEPVQMEQMLRHHLRHHLQELRRLGEENNEGIEPLGRDLFNALYPQPGQAQQPPGEQQAQPQQAGQPGQAQAQPGQPQAMPGQAQAQPGQVQAQPGQAQAQPGQAQAQPGQAQAQPGQAQAQLGQVQAQPGQAQAQPGQAQAQPGQPQAQPGEPQPGQAQAQPGDQPQLRQPRVFLGLRARQLRSILQRQARPRQGAPGQAQPGEAQPGPAAEPEPQPEGAQPQIEARLHQFMFPEGPFAFPEFQIGIQEDPRPPRDPQAEAPPPNIIPLFAHGGLGPPILIPVPPNAQPQQPADGIPGVPVFVGRPPQPGIPYPFADFPDWLPPHRRIGIPHPFARMPNWIAANNQRQAAGQPAAQPLFIGMQEGMIQINQDLQNPIMLPNGLQVFPARPAEQPAPGQVPPGQPGLEQQPGQPEPGLGQPEPGQQPGAGQPAAPRPVLIAGPPGMEGPAIGIQFAPLHHAQARLLGFPMQIPEPPQDAPGQPPAAAGAGPEGAEGEGEERAEPNFHWRADNILAIMRGVQRDLNRNRRIGHWPFVRRGHEDTSRLVTDASLLRFGVSENVIHIGGAPTMCRTSSLRVLVCRGYTRVTDRALSHLAAAAPLLTRLDLSHTAVSPEGARSFRHTRPECVLSCQHHTQ